MKYRIRRDRYAGYQAEGWRWYWPFWCQLFGINTHATVENARRMIDRHASLHGKHRFVEFYRPRSVEAVAKQPPFSIRSLQ